MAMSGQTTVTTAGTEVKLNSHQPCKAVLIKALPTNTGIMYVGNAGDDTVSSSTGFPLSKNETVVVETLNLNNIWVDASVNGEKVAWIILA